VDKLWIAEVAPMQISRGGTYVNFIKISSLFYQDFIRTAYILIKL